AGMMRAAGRRAGSASAALSFFRFVGGAAGAGFVGAFGSSTPWPFACAMVLAGAGAAAALLIGRPGAR
ncbi:MAG: Bcr/CflA family drug resistance efflux transporter, partial [Pseudomonadota bacterium]